MEAEVNAAGALRQHLSAMQEAGLAIPAARPRDHVAQDDDVLAAVAAGAILTTVVAIVSADDHAAALEEIDGLMRAQQGTPEGERLSAMACAVEAWESEHIRLDDEGR